MSRTMPIAPLFAAAALLLLFPDNAAALRQGRAIEDPIRQIQEKWNKMDDFVEIMFTIACKWKHGKDVNGLAAEKLKNGDISGKEVTEFKKQTQAANVQHLRAACGNIVAGGEGKCRQSCADRWGVAKSKRAECDAKCVTAYQNFESGCLQKAEHLETVYSMKLNRAAAVKQCHVGHCKDIPTVWMMEKAEEMTAEVGKQCEAQCGEDSIKARCERKWALEVDFLIPSVKSACFADSKAKACFEEKKGPASTDQKTCASDGDKTCGTQYETCNTKGNTDKTFSDAKAFCKSRKKMCQEQVTKDCQDKFKTALDKAQTECEKADEEALATCEKTKLEEKETEATTACTKEVGPKCKDDCKANCDVAGMNKCLGNLESTNDEAEMFCKDFWHLLHDSAELDPMTGDPIVLLSSHGH